MRYQELRSRYGEIFLWAEGSEPGDRGFVAAQRNFEHTVQQDQLAVRLISGGAENIPDLDFEENLQTDVPREIEDSFYSLNQEFIRVTQKR